MCSKGAKSGKNITKESGEKRCLTEIRIVRTKKGVVTCAKLQNSTELYA